MTYNVFRGTLNLALSIYLETAKLRGPIGYSSRSRQQQITMCC